MTDRRSAKELRPLSSETPLHLKILPDVDRQSALTIVLPVPDDDGTYAWLAVVVVGASATVWLKRREDRERKRLAQSRDIDTLFDGRRFDELCRSIDSTA